MPKNKPPQYGGDANLTRPILSCNDTGSNILTIFTSDLLALHFDMALHLQALRGSSLKYGLLTTYKHTIFLRKKEVGRAWGLKYSPVIYHSNRGSTSGRTVSF